MLTVKDFKTISLKNVVENSCSSLYKTDCMVVLDRKGSNPNYNIHS